MGLSPLSTATAEEQPRPLEVEEVFRLHARDVARWAVRLGGPTVEAEEVLQEVFLTVHQLLPGWRRKNAALTTWLFRITQNVVRHRRRKDRWRRWLTGSAEETAGELPARGPTALDELERQQRERQLYRVLDRMSERSRTVLLLFEIEELSGEEIASLMDAKVGTVWVWLHRARAEFLRRLQEEER